MTDFRIDNNIVRQSSPSFTKNVEQHFKEIKYKNTTSSLSGMSNFDTVHLYQSDFVNGTILLTKPGKYVLQEDIVFDPVAEPPKNDLAFVLGWFAAIAIYGVDITLDLNKHTIRQSTSFHLKQRFWSCIELGNRPFIGGQGPQNFGTPYIAPKWTRIVNGVFGLSSHYAIHGNGPKGLVIEDLEICNYEVAGISINGAENAIIRNVKVKQNYRYVKVNGKFSNAVFILQYAQAILQSNPAQTFILNGVSVSGKDVVDKLQSTVDSILNGGAIPPLFEFNGVGNDGVSYGIALNTMGVLVNDFIKTYNDNGANKNIFLDNVRVYDITTTPIEIPTLEGTDGKINVDTAGGVIPFTELQDGGGKYAGNELSDVQVFVAQIKPSYGGHISDNVMSWIKGDKPTLTGSIVADRDIMAHIGKGVFGLFISSGSNITCNNVNIGNIHSHSQSKLNMGCVSGVCVSGSKLVQINKVKIDGIYSKSSIPSFFKLVGENNTAVQGYILNSLYTSSDYSTDFTPSMDDVSKLDFSGQFSLRE